MADDTRETPSPDASTPQKPRTPANVMPGGTAHTAGGRSAEDDNPSYIQAVKSLGPEYYLNFYKRPCVREGQLMGIGAAFVTAGVAVILRRPMMTCCNVAVFTWVPVSCGAYQYCRYQRKQEKQGMQMAQEIMARKRAEHEVKMKQRKKDYEAHKARLEAERLEEEKRKSWSYWWEKHVKFW